jgi:alginate O-acetyltransferase complex protein AlgI
MIFHSIDFGLVFFPLLLLYWISPHGIQNLLLLVFSYFFYSYSEPWYALLLFGTTAVTYLVSLQLEKEEVRVSKKLSRLYLAIGLGVPMLLLIFFKYAKFFADNLSVATTSFGLGGLTVPAYLLPVGISFFTFHSASYVFDVYRRDVQAAKKFRDYALFLSFFPQLVAGPITRSWALLPQVTKERKVQLAAIRPALTLIMWGYLKKLVIADNLAVITNKVFALQNPSFVLLWVGVLSFGMQIYSDFSAYTDIARGVSRLLGFELAENFKHPYLALSPTEFWRRWHISLSTWFRDYLYIPLGGSRDHLPARLGTHF